MTPNHRGRPGHVKPPSPADLRGRDRHRLAAATVADVEVSWSLGPTARSWYNQGSTPECVAESASELMTLLNGGWLYHVGWLYARAQEIDGIPGSDGTTTDAALRQLRDLGHVVIPEATGVAPLGDDPAAAPDLAHGIDGFAWLPRDPVTALATAREALTHAPILLACSWYGTFTGNVRDGATWVDPVGDWGPTSSRHQLLLDGASDSGGYFTTPNSWGWSESERLSYPAFQRLIREGGDGAVVVDREGTPVPAPTPAPAPGPEHHRRRRRRRRDR